MARQSRPAHVSNIFTHYLHITSCSSSRRRLFLLHGSLGCFDLPHNSVVSPFSSSSTAFRVLFYLLHLTALPTPTTPGDCWRTNRIPLCSTCVVCNALVPSADAPTPSYLERRPPAPSRCLVPHPPVSCVSMLVLSESLGLNTCSTKPYCHTCFYHRNKNLSQTNVTATVSYEIRKD